MTRRPRRPLLLPLVVALGIALLAGWVLMGGPDDGLSAGTPATTPTGPANTPSPGDAPSDAALPAEESSDAEPPDGGATPSRNPAASDLSDPEGGWQASAMNGLLSDSRRSRSDVQAAVDAAARCEAAGVRELKKITAARTGQAAEARELSVDALPNGSDLKNTLVEALDAARDADAGFLAWARRHRDSGCTGRPAGDPGYERGMSRSVDAQAAKERFVDLWRPVADTFDLPYWQADDI